jgi:hypothetical protein
MIRRPRLTLMLAALLALSAAPQAASAQASFIEATGMSGDESLTYTETSDVRFDAPLDDIADDDDASATTQRFSGYADSIVEAQPAAIAPSRRPIAQAGPFFLTSPDTIEMIGTVDSASPRQFAGLIAAHPGVRRLVMVECPGSVDEEANHVLARAVRRAGLTTVVPRGGSVRSGAVDLFLAGTSRIAAADAEFGVHAWRDEDGRGPQDFAANDPVNTEYLNYYREMGMSDDAARRFYALTNATDFENVRYLRARDMAALGLAQVTG